MAYNASVWQTKDGQDYGVFVAEVNAEGKMLRSNAIQCTGYEGTEVYDMYMRLRYPDCEFRIVVDNCAGYKAKLCGLALPPAYTRK